MSNKISRIHTHCEVFYIDGQVCKDITQFPEDLQIMEYPESEAINE